MARATGGSASGTVVGAGGNFSDTSSDLTIEDNLAGGPGLPSTTLRCPDCGMRLVDLRKSGRVGCPRCYEVFRKQILPLLKRVHGATDHDGARPADDAGRADLSRLRAENA